jgi:hypothetical protein
MLQGLVPIKKCLRITASAGAVELTWGMFRPGVERLQGEILDYLHFEVAAPARESARVIEFLQAVFRTPAVFPGPRLGRGEVAATPFAAALGAALVYLIAPDGHAATAAIAFLGLEVLAIAITLACVRRWIRASRFIELSGEGLAVGPDAGSARRIPWQDISLARVHCLAGAPASSLTKLEVRLANGETFFIRCFPDAALLAGALSPSAGLVRTARELVARGATPRDAARSAGLQLGGA